MDQQSDINKEINNEQVDGIKIHNPTYTKHKTAHPRHNIRRDQPAAGNTQGGARPCQHRHQGTERDGANCKGGNKQRAKP